MNNINELLSMKIKNYYILAICILGSTLLQSQDFKSFKIVYEADSSGTRISGNLNDLITKVKNGVPIRVGWELYVEGNESSYILEHWTSANFITILDNQLFAQVSPIYAQGHVEPSKETKAEVYLVNDQPNGWVAVIGTNGILNQKFKRDQRLVEMLLKNMTKEEIDNMFKSKEIIRVKTMWAAPLESK